MNLYVRLIREGARLLEEGGIHRPQWAAEQLLAGRLGCLPVDLYGSPPTLGPEEERRYLCDVAARASGVPLQYLLRSVEFYGRRFAVGPGVFNPRPETEVLVETALDVIARSGAAKRSRFTVADVGTGSGAIAIALAEERPGLEISAVEKSAVALRFAWRNAAVYGSPVRFLQADLLEGFAPASLDAVVANLPYLNPAQAGSWPRELAWEPWLALDGGRGGLELIGRLVSQAQSALKPGGWMALEIGMDQAQGLRPLAERSGFCVERIVPDLAGLDRVAVLRWKD